jgi:transposase
VLQNIYEKEASLAEVITIGLDIAKNVFQAHGSDAGGHQVFSRRIARGKVLEFLGEQPKCLVALEACGGAHHWARSLIRLGHEVKLIPPAYVKPFVKRQKNDAAEPPRFSRRLLSVRRSHDEQYKEQVLA